MTDERIGYVAAATQAMAEHARAEKELGIRRARALQSLIDEGNMTVTDVAEATGIPRQTLYKALKRAE